MSDPVPPRVRVTGPERRRAPVRRTAAIDSESRLGTVYVGSLLQEQGWLAVRVLVLLAVGVGAWPLLFHLVPSLADVDLLGLPLAWLVVGVLVYPYLLLLGWIYVRRAERNERAFTDLVEDRER
ncbi:hypothetical protein [Nocardioides sp. SYSU D00038]|uniref:hypothetical protein n=1 Tax=Nocardioides sp. SYSU D00038 TaxID=2812554 RepID=UPI0019676715|nr:hypothetical protein [Nocardioides sp. SYSU D00038]